MSAFIVSNATMHRVVKAIDDDAGTIRTFAGFPLAATGDLDELGQALFELNSAAVENRYPTCRPLARASYRYRPLGPLPETHQFKALACLVYQCSEGKVPEHPLYKALAGLRDKLARKIAHEASKDVPWDFPERVAG